MLRKFGMSCFVIFVFTFSVIDVNAAAPTITTNALLKKITTLESEVKKLKDQNILMAKTINYFFDYQKENNSLFEKYDKRLIDIEDNLDGYKGINKQIKSINSALNDSDGIICRIKQIEKDIYKSETSYFAYEPVCITY